MEKKKQETTLRIPTDLELPKPEERVFNNEVQPKPDHRAAKIDIKFGELTEKNLE